ncbi:MAG: S-methyl-5-thioribose-1-phosphate isomerase [Pseudomonadota bacterium]|nr:S-methyl-5-thioribose-1-phosphate isomerase [Pseudomonadota bacterium]
MLVNGQHLTTIWYEENNDAIRIIDQRLLPHELKILTLHSLAEVLFAIKDMLVRGAPLIGITAAYGMYIAARENSSIGFLRQSGENLKLTRPTAVNLSWAVDLILDKIINIEEVNRPDYVLNLANQMRLADIQACKDIGENGFKLLETIYKKKNSTINILTHCNAGWLATVDWGTALSPIFKAKKKDIPIHVWVDETRPRNQGFNLTAWELINENIPNSLIVDNVGGHLMQKGMVDVCITGTDRTSLNGDVCNKIGTYLNLEKN